MPFGRRAALGALLLTCTLVGVVAGPVAARPFGEVTEFPLPVGDVRPLGITAGPDAAMWFTEFGAEQIGRITLDGTITTFGPTLGQPSEIEVGSDGNLWFTDDSGNAIGRITLDGTITEFPLPSTCGSTCRPIDLVSGPDGRLWFTERDSDAIGVIDPLAPDPGTSIQELPIPGCAGPPVPDCAPLGIAVGPDGLLWFVMNEPDQVWFVDTAGMFPGAPIQLPGANPGAFRITTGPDSNLWVTEIGASAVARVTVGGEVTTFPTPTPNTGPTGIATGPDGALWFGLQLNSSLLGHVTTDGTVTELPLPTAGIGSNRVAVGPDCNMWVTEGFGDVHAIGRVGTGVELVGGVCGGSPPTPIPVAIPVEPTFTG